MATRYNPSGSLVQRELLGTCASTLGHEGVRVCHICGFISCRSGMAPVLEEEVGGGPELPPATWQEEGPQRQRRAAGLQVRERQARKLCFHPFLGRGGACAHAHSCPVTPSGSLKCPEQQFLHKKLVTCELAVCDSSPLYVECGGFGGTG